MFSFKVKSNQPVAVVNGGSLNGKKLYIHQDQDRKLRKANDNPDYFFYCKLDDGTFMYLPEQRKGQTSRIAVCSNAGAGKSVNVCNYVKKFHETFPDAEKTILLTGLDSQFDHDDSFKPCRELIDTIVVDEQFAEEPLELSDLYNEQVNDDGENYYVPQLIIFDDYEDLPIKVEKELNRLRKSICTLGRKKALYLVCVNQTLEIKKTDFRNFINNTTNLLYFPAREPNNLKYMLKTHYDIGDDLYKDIHRNTTSRWVLINKDDTPYILTETSALIYDPLREQERLKVNKIKNNF